MKGRLAPSLYVFIMKLELVDNERSDSGSDSGGSVGTNSGSGSGTSASGNDRDSIGNGGNVSGNGGNVSGSERGTGTDNAGSVGGNAMLDADRIDTSSNEQSANGSSDVDRRNRSERTRRNRSIRLGGTDRDRVTDSIGGTDNGNAETRIPFAPSVRLGERKQGRPKAEAKADALPEANFSELKGYVSIFLDSIFEIPAQMLGHNWWRLEKDENKQLTDAIIAYIKSLPKSRGNWIVEFMQQNLPLINLLMQGFYVVSHRVRSSLAYTQAQKFMAPQTIGKEPTNAAQNEKPLNTVSVPMDGMFH